MRHECKQYKAKSSERMTGRIRVDRGRGVYIHKADKESKKKTKREKVGKRFVRARKRMDRRKAVIASKDQI